MTGPFRSAVALGVAMTAMATMATLAACASKDAETPPVAAITVTFDRDKVPAASALEVTYKFVVSNDATFEQNYRVFAQVKDADGERIWDDDHNPPTPTTEWKPGQTVEYTRTIFVPVFPYIGEATLEAGLYSTTGEGKRLTLSGGESVGQHAYRVVHFELLPQTENLYTVYKDGWHMGESSKQDNLVEWQWTKKDAALSFRNLKKDLTLYLELDASGSPYPSQEVQVVLGGQTVETLTVPPGDRQLHKIKLPATLMGTDEMAELHIVVDKTFVPAQTNPTASKDIRALGVRVFHAYIDAR